jgi:hypothetical protein
MSIRVETPTAGSWLKGANGLAGAGGVAGPSAALRFAQEDEFFLNWRGQEQQQQKKQVLREAQDDIFSQSG